MNKKYLQFMSLLGMSSLLIPPEPLKMAGEKNKRLRTIGDDEISATGQRVVHTTLNKKNIERKQKHYSMVSELASKGIVWYNNKLYWATRKLAEANK
jgi:hypothetical protein